MGFSRFKRKKKIGEPSAKAKEKVKQAIRKANRLAEQKASASLDPQPDPQKLPQPDVSESSPEIRPAAVAEATPRGEDRKKIILAATFTIEPILPGMATWQEQLKLETQAVPAHYNQVFQELLNPVSLIGCNDKGMNVLFLRFQDWLHDFDVTNRAKTASGLERYAKKREVYLQTVFKDFLEAIKAFESRARSHTLVIVCPATATYTDHPKWRALFSDLEQRLLDYLEGIGGMDGIRADSYHDAYEIEIVHDPLRNEIGHIPYTDDYYLLLATLVTRRYANLIGHTYKVLVLDCDNTLWGGVCGEVGPQGVDLGEPFVTFQRFLIEQKNAGMVLCLCSKNVEEDVWAVFDSREDMALKREHLVDTRINWMPKSQNLASLAQALNLGIDSFIFIDDNPVEIAEVRANRPEVLALPWPKASAEALRFLNHTWVFDHFSVTSEDTKRTQMYKANLEREQLLAESTDFSEFFKTLKMQLDLGPVTNETLPRTAQLTNRTNQFNFTTIRRSQSDVAALMESENHEIRTAHVADRFGEYGLVGVLILEKQDDVLFVDTFLLSCRVLGRGVEYRIMAHAGEVAREKGCSQVRIEFRKTAKNEPAYNFIQKVTEGYPAVERGEDREWTIPAENVANFSFEIPTAVPDEAVTQKKDKPAKVSSESVRDLENRLALIAARSSNLQKLKSPAAASKQVLATEEHQVSPASESSANVLSSDTSQAPAATDQAALQGVVLAEARRVFAEILGLPASELDAHADLETYVDDSFKNVELTVAINDQIATVPATLLFEQRTLAAIADFLIAEHAQDLATKYVTKLAVKASPPAPVTIPAKPAAATVPLKKKRPREEAGDIAVIGISGKYPGADNVAQFWKNLAKGECAIAEIPAERWNAADFYDPEGGTDKSYNKWGGFLKNVDRFDARFFKITPKEAELMDPQQRLFLEVVWCLLENAGYTRETISRETGVFVGMIASDYGTITAEASLLGKSAYRASDYYQLPNRVSYFFDFHGPSMAVDTACSASGTSLHLACDSLKKGECKLAIAGGVNLFLHPSRFVQYAQLQFFSQDDRIRPFGADASGTLFGEGIGAVLLKPLEEAERDGDHIYGLIKSTSINSGGKTNGFTVPNPQAQASLVSNALAAADIDPRTISYIEAHGTGTPLGDPIEIRGLTLAFNQSAEDKLPAQYCAIGSVKSNIGHLESGAAISGLTKVLLQMEHGKLAPSLNAEKLNPKIAFAETPFRVNSTLSDWERLRLEGPDGEVTVPRRAGLSSFGAGGSNAHIIIEEYPSEVPVTDEEGPWIFPLSAASEDRLAASAQQLAAYLKQARKTEIKPDLARIAFTLQTGREPMNIRLAVIAADVNELITRLAAVNSAKLPQGCYQGNVRSGKAKAILVEGEEGREFLRLVIKNRKLDKLARLWVSGIGFDWLELNPRGTKRRMPLPTYPFAGESYWLPETRRSPTIETAVRSVLHPLLDSNESTLHEQCFRKTLRARTFVLKHHLVQGRMILPGVAYLEMARAAGSLSNKIEPVTRLRNIIWASPVVVKGDEPHEIHLSLAPYGEEVSYEIYSTDVDGERAVHAQGKLHFGDEPEAVEAISLEGLLARASNSMSREACYELYRKNGFDFGPGFRPIQELHFNETEAFSRLALPEEIADTAADFLLHPSLMDGALQSVIGLTAAAVEEAETPFVPFGLEEVEIIAPPKPECYVHVTSVAGGKGAQIRKFNITIMDTAGNPLVRLKDYSLRSVRVPTRKETFGPLTYSYSWQEAPLPGYTPAVGTPGNILVLHESKKKGKALCERLKKESPTGTQVVLVTPAADFTSLATGFELNPKREKDYLALVSELAKRDQLPGLILHMWSQNAFSTATETLQDQLDNGVFSQLHLCRALLAQKIRHSVRLIHLYPLEQDGCRPPSEAIAPFFKTLHMENPLYSGSTVAIAAKTRPAQLANIILQEFNQSACENVRYEKNTRKVTLPELHQTVTDPAHEEIFQERGVYLITGGLGGIALHFAEHLAKKYSANLVLVGRSRLNVEREAHLQKLQALGSRVLYLSADVADQAAVTAMTKKARAHFGRINGVLHTAGINEDAFLLKKTAAQMERVLAPKVRGTVCLDEATAADALDFFVVFSSLTGLTGNLGQADYAFANAFMDNYASYRRGLVSQKQRSGRTLAISWPLWRGGGMQVDEQAEKRITTAIGIRAMDAGAGIAALERGLTIGADHIFVAEGKAEQIGAFLRGEKPAEKKKPAPAPPSRTETAAATSTQAAPATSKMAAADTGDLPDKVTLLLKEILSKETKLPVSKIDAEEPLEEYGIDSVMVLSLSNELEGFFGELSKTLLFEYQSIAELTDYFLENHHETLVAKLGSGPTKADAHPPQEIAAASNAVAAPVPSSPVPVAALPQLSSRFLAAGGDVTPQITRSNEDIAIVGISGRYPRAIDLEAFWENLMVGLDCIVEIPPDRWDYRQYFDPDRDKRGKTYSKWGGFIDEVDKFDPLFFNISPREARNIEPQERIFLETAWKTIEDAGYTRSKLAGSEMGVYVGIMWGHYQLFGPEETMKGNPLAPDSSYSSVANRVSYYFDLQGPSMAIDTMCSSSLTSIHLACEAIRTGEIEAAIAGAVNLTLRVDKYLLLSQGKFTSSDGRCRSFGEGGDGYVPGEGVGAVMLKPLSRAITDGDFIHGVIKGTSINHGGKTNGYTVPNPKAQGNLVKKALKNSGIDPKTISYIEAHGTGTSLGDPIEISGLRRAFDEHVPDKQSIPIGSVKSNVGHLEAAAGMVGLSKILLQMKYQKLVPSIHSQTLNPHIKFEASPFYVQRQLSSWDKPVIRENGREITYPRRAGISSFGAGGSNAHLLVEEYEMPPRTMPTGPIPRVFVLSAKGEDRLQEYAANLQRFLENRRPDVPQPATTDEHRDYTELVQADLISIVAEVLRIDAANIDAEEDLTGLGFDTASLAVYRHQVAASFTLDLKPAVLSEHPTIHAFASHLNADFAPILIQKYGNSAPVTTAAGKPPTREEPVDLADVAFTLQTGREAMPFRIAIVAEDHAGLIERLAEVVSGKNENTGFYQGNTKERQSTEPLIEGEEGREFINSVISKRKFSKLAQLWVAGVAIDWNLLYSAEPQHSRPRRIPLPTYPFARKRCWLPISDNLVAEASPTAATHKEIMPLAGKPLYFRGNWVQEDLPAKPTAEPVNFLVFDHGEDVRDTMIRMRDENPDQGPIPKDSKIILVKPGQSFAEVGVLTFSLNPQEPGDFQQLAETLTGIQLHPNYVFYLWNQNRFSREPNSLRNQLEMGPYALLFLTQALLAQRPTAPVHLLYVFSYDVPQPQHVAISGMAKTVRLENSKLVYKTVALQPAAGINRLDLLLNECYDEEGSATEIRYEGRHRFVKKLTEFQPETESTVTSTGAREIAFKDGGVYLLTGGTGGLGLIFAREIARRVKAKIILTGRSALDPSKTAIIDELNALGARAAYMPADISKRAEAKKLVAEIKKRYQKIDGLLHTAGVLRDSYIVNKTREDMETVLAAKVYGTVWLDEATRDENLDFFVLFSSMTSVMGNAGQCDYAYGNGFMDSFAELRDLLEIEQNRSGKSLSVNWPLWRQGGMQVDARTEKLLAKTQGITPLLTESGLDAFALGLTFPFPGFVVAEGEPEKLRATLGTLTADPNRPGEGEIDLDVLRELIEEEIATMVSKILHVEMQDVHLDAEMNEFGFDSVTLTEFSNEVNDAYNLGINPAIFFEHTSLRSFSGYLVNDHAASFHELYKLHMGAIETSAPPVEEAPIVVEYAPAPATTPAPAPTIAVTAAREREPIAIIGMSGVMPGSPDLDSFWRHLDGAANLISEVPADRWDWQAIYGDPEEGNKTRARWAGFIGDVDKFDAGFFGISPLEARLMDPQQRLFLETAWKTIEDAGYQPNALSGSKTGLFVGVGPTEYYDMLHDGPIEAHMATGNSHPILVNRISYLLNLRGPSEPIDTACSSSLVAVHRAIESIYCGDCDTAIAGAVSLLLSPSMFIAGDKAGMLSPDGQCKTFDKDANGYVKAEGVGAVLLKPLSRAIADGDHVYAVIKGSAVNHGGRAQSLTSPNPLAQSELLQDAYTKANVDPSTISYIETHGTGTPLGDPIEINGLKTAFKKLYQDWGKPDPPLPHCGLGSVKTNVGHLEVAAGMAGLLKLLLALKHKKIPASINIKEINPYINLTGSPFSIVRKTSPWNPLRDEMGRSVPRRAGISSFGFGGVNAHLVLEEYEATLPAATAEPHVFVFSAKSAERLAAYVAAFDHYLDQASHPDETAFLGAFAHTLQVGREAMTERLAFIAADKAELKHKIALFRRDGSNDTLLRGADIFRATATTPRGKGSSASPPAPEVKDALAQRNMEALARLWVHGAVFDWASLYGSGPLPPARIPLPTYPFERRRHWAAEYERVMRARTMAVAKPARSVLHPLVGENTSTLGETCFTTQLNGSEFFLADHNVSGTIVLPGVACLEMAVAAAELAGGRKVAAVADMVWTRAISRAEALDGFAIALAADSSNGATFSVFTNGADHQRTPHAEGSVTFAQGERPANGDYVDIAQIRQRCTTRDDHETCYRRYQAMGLHFGPAFQVIHELAYNQAETLARLVLPRHLEASFHDYRLHPSLLDASLQTLTGLLSQADRDAGVPYLPFSLGSLEILAPLSETGYVYATPLGRPAARTNSPIRVYEILLLDDHGKVLVKMKNLALRALTAPARTAVKTTASPSLQAADPIQSHPFIDEVFVK